VLQRDNGIMTKAKPFDLQMRFLRLAVFVNQINFKNVTVFSTNAFKRKTALNK